MQLDVLEVTTSRQNQGFQKLGTIKSNGHLISGAESLSTCYIALRVFCLALGA